MTDPESILQLGIEAAREGNNEEARSLFRLLTRENPDNVRGWFWLAGVAENREERQQALERVLELDPGNDLAMQSLNAMGARPTERLQDDVGEGDTETPPAETPPPPAPRTTAPLEPEEDDPFAELDSLSDAFSEDPGAVRRSAATPEAVSPVGQESDQTGKPAPEMTRSEKRAGGWNGTSEKDEDVMSTKEGNNRLRPLLLVAFVLVLLLAAAWYLNIPGRFFATSEPAPPPADQAAEGDRSLPEEGLPAEGMPEEGAPAEGAPAEGAPAEGVPAEGVPAEGVPAEGAPEEGVPAEGAPEEGAPAEGAPAEGAPEQPAPEQPAPEQPAPEQPAPEQPAPEQPAPEQPAPEQPAPEQPAPDVAAADPAVVPPNTPLEANGWLYDFNNPAYATYVPGSWGGLQPQQGRTVIVLVFVVNRTGQPQAIPADFFVVKDAQGRVYYPQPEASSIYLNQAGGRGSAADLSQQDQVPADGLTRSVPLLFDVPADATGLKLFSSAKTDQGWLILQNVQ